MTRRQPPFNNWMNCFPVTLGIEPTAPALSAGGVVGLGGVARVTCGDLVGACSLTSAARVSLGLDGLEPQCEAGWI
eukprot:3325260-Rhodomonas_salina.1